MRQIQFYVCRIVETVRYDRYLVHRARGNDKLRFLEDSTEQRISFPRVRPF